MKSYSKFIIEKKRGTVSASPAPGDPLDPKGRKKIDKKFSDPSNPPKVANPEAPKSNPAPKPTAVNQADVSKQAAKYRRAERVKGATGGKPTGSLSKGNLSFPGDRSGATARVKSDIEARKGFSGSRSGGLKADEANPNVNRSVRQQRTVKQGIPDPFKSKTPAPADPFKGITSAKPVKPSMPDPFKGSASVPPKPKKTGAPERPAMRQAVSDIKAVRKRLGITKSSTPKPSIPKPPKTVEQTPVNKYFRTMQDQGRSVDPDLVGPQGLKASGAKPEMVGGSTAPTGTGTRMRAKGDAIRDISKAKNADLDKALKNLVNTGDVTKSKPSGPSSSIGFKQFSMKADKVTQSTKPGKYTYPGGTINPTTGRGSGGSVNPSTNKPEYKNTNRSGYAPELKPKPGSEPVVFKPKYGRVTDSQPKVVNPSTNKPEFKNTGRSGYKPEYKPKSGSAPVPSKSGDITLEGPFKGKPRFPENPKGSALAKNKSFSQFSVDSGRGRGGALTKVDDIIDVKVKDLGPTKQPALPGGSGAASTAKSAAKPLTKKSIEKMVKGTLGTIGKGAGRALGAAGAGIDSYMNYRKYRNQGDGKLRSGLKSAFRTSLGWLGGAAGATIGGLAGGVGAVGGGIAGYSGGTWLADKVLGATTKKKLGSTKK